MFYAPANLYPVLIMDYMGRHSENTVWGGVVRLYQDGMWFVATVVFFASIVVPLVKLTGLLLLVINLGPRWRKERTWLYQTIFALHDKPEDQWLKWAPTIPLAKEQ